MQNNFSKCREWVPRGTSQHKWRWLTTLLLILTLGIGQMWAAATSTNPATKSYGGKTFLDVAATAANARIKNSDSTLVYNSTYLLKTLNPAWITGTTATDKSDSKSSFSNLPDYGFLAEGSSSGVNTTNAGGYSYIKITNEKEFVIYVTGTNSIAFLGKGNKNKSDKWIGVKVEEIDSEGNATVVADASSNKNYSSSNAITEATTNTASEALVISPNKYYRATVTSGNSSNCQVWQFRFGKVSGYSVTYVENGHGANQTDLTGQTKLPSTLPTLSESGWIFGGWYTDEGLTTPAVAGATLSANATLYAKWTEAAGTQSAISYTNTKGATNTNPDTYYEGTGIASFEPLADVTDFHFTGWSPASIADDATGEQTIEAQWVDAYNVSFSAGAGSGTVPSTFQKWEGATFELPGQGSMTAPSGKAFDGWKASGTKYAAGAEYTMTAAAVEFVAQWKAAPTVLFHYNMGNIDAAPADGTENSATGGKILFKNAKMGKESSSFNAAVKGDMIGGANSLKLGGNADSIRINLTTGNFQEGDTIYITGYNPFVISTTTARDGDVVESLTTGTAKTDYNIGYCVIPAGIDSKYLYIGRTSSSCGFAAIKVIRPAARPVFSTEITLSDVKVNGTSISAANLATLVADHSLTLGDEFVTAPEIKFNEHKVITYDDELLPATKVTDKVYTVTATTVSDNWQAQQEINAITYTVTAPKQSSVKLAYYDGATKLGEETVGIGGHPAEYAAKQSKDFATFVAWYSNSDLAEEHKIANIAELVVNEATNVYGKWTPAYASSINIEQWVLDNGVNNTPFRAELTARNYQYTSLNNLDSLNDDPSKPYRNYAYLGQKVNKTDSEIKFLLKSGSTLNVRFGHIGTPLNVVIGSAEPVELTSAEYANDAPGDKKYTYTATEDVIVKFQTTGTSTCVFKQIMIDEDLQTVTLPWRVTYNANGGTCATASAVWSGSALILPDVTPAEPTDYSFAGWYDEATGGVLVGAAGASYTPTDNTTLHAQFAPVEYAIAYDGNGATSGSMTAGAAGWGTLVTPDANAFVKSGNVFSGWVITKTSDGSATGITFSEGKFEMPKYDVTLVAQWEDNSKVAVIVETNVKYESLADAVAAATDGQTIQLLQNNNVTAQVEVAGKAITLDLAGYKIEYTGTSTLPSGVILVHNGASLTIDDSSDPDAGSIVSGADAYAAIALTKAGDDATNPAVLVINGGIFTGYYYAITGNGSRHNTEITINAGTFTGTAANDNSAIYHPQQGTLIINGGTFTGYSAAIELRAGTLEINDGTFTATATEYSCNPSGSGTTTVGAAIAIAQHNTQKDIAVTINGGTFEGVKAINEANPQGNPAPAVAMSVTGGDFTGEVSTVDVHEFISGGTYDAPVTNENCAYGYVPAPEVAPGVYTVMPKDGVEIIGVVVTGNTTGTVSGLYKGDASVNLNSKKLDSGKYIYVTLKEGYTFEENDVLIVDVNAKSNIGTSALEITTGVGNIDGAVWKTLASDEYSTGDNSITLEGIAAGQTSIGLKRSDNQNAKINGLRVLRPMKPMLTAITIDDRAGVINEAAKTVAVQIPYESDLAALTVVPTIVWNEAAATNSIVVNDGSAWIEGANTYKLTDKDGDYTVYTITLTRDVQKHTVSFNTHGGSAVANELVVHGESLAAAPADPTKEENVFKHWAETEDGEAVDVTSFAITADKEFHAVWEAEPAGIKLFTDLGLNTTNFISAAKATDSVEINTIKYPYLVAFGSNRTSLAEAKQADLVMYSATTDATKIKFDLYNTNGSAKTAYVWLVEEGDDAATKLGEIEIAGETRVKTAYYEFNGTKNRTVYLTSGAKNDIKVLQAKVIESGSAIHQFGQAGYVVDFNKGRIAGAADGTVSFEGAAITLKSDYKVLNSTSLSPKTYIQFNNPVANTIVKIKRSGSNKYYVTNDLGNKGTEYSSDQEITLTATGTWYIGSVNPGSAAQITKIEFVAPKCAEPQFNALANSDVCAGDGYVALAGTATVADAGVPTYQWYREDDSAIDGETNATYTPTADGKYYVIAVNHLAGYTDNEKKSALVTVTTHAGTVITEPLVDLRGAKDAELALTVEATGKNLHYAWKESATIDGTYTDVAGATDSKTLNVTVTEGMDKYYKVVVSSDCGSDLESVAHVTQFVPVSQQDVTASIVWDWSEAASGNTDEMKSNTTPKRDTEFIMANGDARIYNNANFCSDKLVISGQYAVRGGNYFQGGLVKFHTTVPGVVRVEFSHTATATAEKPARELFINGVGTGTIAASASHVRTAFIEVPAGDVSITAQYIDPTKPGNQYVRVYKVEFYTIAEQRTTGYAAGDLGTVCLEDATIIDGANLYKLAGLDQYGYLAFDEIQSGELEAGVPYLFEVTNPSMIGFYKQVNAAHSDDEIAHKGMIGTFSGTTLNQNVAENYYYFSGRHIWRVNDFTVGITIPAHRCYVDYDAVQAAGPAQAPAAGCRRVTLGVNGKNTATDVENLNASEAPVKLIIDGKMYILRGEKLFDATGRLVK